jgi:hypothetical protein
LTIQRNADVTVPPSTFQLLYILSGRYKEIVYKVGGLAMAPMFLRTVHFETKFAKLEYMDPWNTSAFNVFIVFVPHGVELLLVSPTS